jgi:transcriptional repressor OPI1
MIEDEPEPLLSLITSTHPWIGGTISGSLYAYNSTMHYSPAWVQSALEKNLQAVANGLGSVSRVTGVESRVRQYLGDTPDRRLSNAKAGSSHKRPREPSIDQMDIEKGYILSPSHSRQRSRTGSQASFDTLPAYDENRAPEYEKQHQQQLAVQQGSHAWSTRLVITTSGLGAALSDKSLRSLKFCLATLRMATERLAEIMNALRSLISDYESTLYSTSQHNHLANLTAAQQHASEQIALRIKNLGTHIMNILREVTANVSRYAGGALPENAGALVRRQLMSVPQRWKFAEEKTSTPNGEKEEEEMVRTGQRWLVFAEQGCDMIAQVSIVLSGTVESAEKWLDTMGRKQSSRRESVVSSISGSGTIGQVSEKTMLG